MLLSLLFQAAFAGGPTPWDPAIHATDTTLLPVTVHVTNGPSGYVRAEITNNLKREISFNLWTETADETGLVSFEILGSPVNALCAGRISDFCEFDLQAGEQVDIIIAYTPSESVDVFGQLTVQTHIADLNNVEIWSYEVQKPLIAKARAEGDQHQN